MRMGVEPGRRLFRTLRSPIPRLLPAKIYANEGLCQILFFKGNEPCEINPAGAIAKASN